MTTPFVSPPLNDDAASETLSDAEAAERLIQVGIRMASHQSLDEILSGLVDDARSVVGARYAALGILSPSGDYLERFITSGLTDEERAAIGPEPRGKGLLGLLIQDPRPVRIGDLTTDPRSCGVPSAHPTMRSFLGVPIIHRDEVFGNLYLTEKLKGTEFTERDERIALTLAAQAAVALTNQRRVENEARLRGEMETVREVTAAILGTLDLQTLLPLIVRRAQELCGADTVALALGSGKPRLRVAHGADTELVMGTASHAEALKLFRNLEVPRHLHVEQLTVAGDPIGALTAIAVAPLAPSAERLLSLFAQQASVAIANAEAFAAERERLRESARIQAAEARATVLAGAVQRAVNAQEAERARIARELHDEAGQSLTALALAMRILDEHVDDAGRTRLGELRQMVNGISSDLRALATDLRPSGLREHGLASAIERQAARLSERCDTTIDAIVSGDFDDLPEAVQIGILRVVQEALTNAVRHSEADRVSVLVTRSESHVRAVVEDDGKGFDPHAPTERLGIKGMRERVEILGGDLRIESTQGEGTTVIVDVEGIVS